MGKYDGYWEMREGGPHQKGKQVFKCTDCNATTAPSNGHSGAPDTHNCTDGCRNRAKAETDWRPKVSPAYRDNYSRIFGHD